MHLHLQAVAAPSPHHHQVPTKQGKEVDASQYLPSNNTWRHDQSVHSCAMIFSEEIM